MRPVFPIAYFGSIRYFRELSKYNSVKLEIFEHFPKQTLRNRTNILTANGILTLSVPVEKVHGSKTLTRDIGINYDKKWQLDHWRAIRSAYQSAPYFDHYGMEIEELLFSNAKSLVEFDVMITQRICKWLALDVNFELSNSFEKIGVNDYRTTLSNKQLEPSSETPYIQVFPSEQSYSDDLSILDAILCEGPLARNLLLTNQTEIQ